MTVTAENIHVAGGINYTGVSISGGWSGTLHKVSLLRYLISLHSLLTFDFGNQFRIDLKTLVSVLNNESVFHAHRGG